MLNPDNHKLKHITDPDGKEIIGVYVRNTRKYAFLHKEDYERIVAQIGYYSWTMGHNGQGRNYVYIKLSKPKSRIVYITRLIAGDLQGLAVRFKDGNSLNLRQDNLYHDAGRGGEPLRKRFKLHVAGLPSGGRAALRIPENGEVA